MTLSMAAHILIGTLVAASVACAFMIFNAFLFFMVKWYAVSISYQFLVQLELRLFTSEVIDLDVIKSALELLEFLVGLRCLVHFEVEFLTETWRQG